jgi:hypothetical protein
MGMKGFAKPSPSFTWLGLTFDSNIDLFAEHMCPKGMRYNLTY